MARPLRIGIDAWLARTHAPGLGRYARELVRAAAALPEAPELRLLEVGPGRRSFPVGALGEAGARARRVALRAPRSVLELSWRAARIGAERWLRGVDLFHRVQLGSPPVGDVPVVAPVFELPPRESGLELERLAAVIVASDAAARALAARFPRVAERIRRVPVGADHWRRAFPGVPVREGRPRILALGATAARRRPLVLLRALESLRARGVDCELVFAGGRGDRAAELADAIAESRAREAITWIERPREAELPEFVARSSVLAHLSEEELTAVTPLEAFSLGAAVVASPLGAFAEDLGGLATLVGEDQDPHEVAWALERELGRAHDVEARAARMRHAARFTWEAHAQATLAIWHSIVEGT